MEINSSQTNRGIKRSQSDSSSSTNAIYECEYCSLTFTTSSNRLRHCKRKHADELQKVAKAAVSHECLLCGRGYPTVDHLRTHLSQCSGRISFSSATTTTTVSSAPSLMTATSSASSSCSTLNSASSAGQSNFIPSNNSSSSSSTALVPFGSNSAMFDLSILVIDDQTFNSIFNDFLQWCGTAPMSDLERQVKQSRAITTEQLLPIRNTLKHLVNILLQHRLLSKPSELKISHFAQIEVIQCINNHMSNTGVKHSRIYQIMLLIKKLCVFLVAKMSAQSGLYMLPQNSIPSWTFLEEVCRESCSLRKMESANRHAGISSTRPSRPSANSASSSVLSSLSNTIPLPNSTATATQINPILISPQSLSSTIEVPSKEEMTLLAKHCLTTMRSYCDAPNKLKEQKNAAVEYASSLLTVMFLIMPSQRSQVMRNLVIGLAQPLPNSIVPPEQTLFRTTQCWDIRIRAEANKNSKPVILSVNEVLTEYMDFFVQHGRMLLVASNSVDRGYLFSSRNGTAKDSFIAWTNSVTMKVLGRPINPHVFRSACVTLLYDNNQSTGSNSEREMISLANLMGHSVDTARSYYYKQSRENESKSVNQQLNQLLGVSMPTLPSTTSTAAAVVIPEQLQPSSVSVSMVQAAAFAAENVPSLLSPPLDDLSSEATQLLDPYEF